MMTSSNQHSVVFVAQENPRLNYTDAERFGDVVFCTDLEFSPVTVARNSLIVGDLAQSIGAKFDPNRDYLLMSGNPITMGIAIHMALTVAVRAGCKEINVLHWNNQRHVYSAARVPVPTI